MAKILVIDDDPALRRSICRMLARGGYETAEAQDGLAGLAAFAGERFDLVLCDLIMPNQEGIETIQKLRELDLQTPVIAMSGSIGDDGFSPLDDAILLGADLVLAKPFSMKRLLDAVGSRVERSGPTSAQQQQPPHDPVAPRGPDEGREQSTPP